MEKQCEINSDMRAILIDWLVQVHLKFKLLPETLFMTVSLIDKYLEKCQVDRENLQLVGISALFISSKYEEIYPPHTKVREPQIQKKPIGSGQLFSWLPAGFSGRLIITAGSRKASAPLQPPTLLTTLPFRQDFIEVTDRTYTKYQLFEMEGKILQALDFEITIPSSLRFLDRYCRVMNIEYESKQYFVCRYLLELTLLDVKYLQYSASNIACSAIYLSQKLFHQEECWNESITSHAKYTEKQVRFCSRDLCLQLKDIAKNSNEAIRKKFLNKKFLEVATITIDQIKKE